MYDHSSVRTMMLSHIILLFYLYSFSLFNALNWLFSIQNPLTNNFLSEALYYIWINKGKMCFIHDIYKRITLRAVNCIFFVYTMARKQTSVDLEQILRLNPIHDTPVNIQTTVRRCMEG